MLPSPFLRARFVPWERVNAHSGAAGRMLCDVMATAPVGGQVTIWNSFREHSAYAYTHIFLQIYVISGSGYLAQGCVYLALVASFARLAHCLMAVKIANFPCFIFIVYVCMYVAKCECGCGWQCVPKLLVLFTLSLGKKERHWQTSWDTFLSLGVVSALCLPRKWYLGHWEYLGMI